MRIHHLSAGTMCPFGARLIHGHGGWTEPSHMVCHCWVIETNDGLVLVDTGWGTHDLERPYRMGRFFHGVMRPKLSREETLLAQLEGMGFQAADVRHIVPTHLDLDHVGGLSDFPHAQVHVFRRELEAALAPATLQERRRYRGAYWSHGPRWDPRDESGETWFEFAGVRAMAGQDDILLIPLHGHTRGHCGVAVRTEDGWLLHAGDAYFSHEEMQTPPSCPPGLQVSQRLFAVDEFARRKNQDRLRALLATHGTEVRVHCAHSHHELEHFAGCSSTP